MADSAMTGEAGANRTFRSIFGDQDDAAKLSDELQLEQSLDASAEDDEDMWSDVNGAEDNNDLPLQFAQRKSMEEWAEDDDEEENWKDALQDRVNQLELAFQHNNDAAAAESRRRFEEQQRQLDQETPRVDFSQSLPASMRFTASGRHKMQRTSSLHACVTGESTPASSSTRSSQLWNFQRKVVAAPSTFVQAPRKRSTSIDFVARNIQSVEHHRKRSGSLSSASNRTDSPRSSLSRKNSMESSRNHLIRSNSSHFRGTKAAAASSRTSSAPAASAVFNLSDTEAIRRYVLDDVKHMSMERLVNEAQRLHFLENFYENHQSTTTSMDLQSPSSSSSAMSTS